MLKLSSGLRIHPKVRLKRLDNFYTFWHVEKGSSTPNRTMQGCKGVIRDRHALHEMLFEERFILMDSDGHILKDHAKRDKLSFQAMVDDFTIVLCSNTGKDFAFCLRNPKTLKSILDAFWYIIPALCISRPLRLCIVVNRSQIERAQVRSPRGDGFRSKYLECLQPELEHPVWFISGSRNLPHHHLINSWFCKRRIYDIIPPIEELARKPLKNTRSFLEC